MYNITPSGNSSCAVMISHAALCHAELCRATLRNDCFHITQHTRSTSLSLYPEWVLLFAAQAFTYAGQPYFLSCMRGL